MTWGNGFKKRECRFRLDTGEFFLTMVNHWKEQAIQREATSLETFKIR